MHSLHEQDTRKRMMNSMKVTVQYPAAWCWAPLKGNPLVSDPDVQDTSPRYSAPPAGGWSQIGVAVNAILENVQSQNCDLLCPSVDVELNVDLTVDAQFIVFTWFHSGEAPQWSPGSGHDWLNGRHRTWGVATAGFDVAPILNIPFGDEIHFWRPDLDGWDPLDREDLEYHRADLDWWLHAPDAEIWRNANPLHAEQWGSSLSRWDQRLSSSMG